MWPLYAEALRLRHLRDARHFRGVSLSPQTLRDATIDWHDYERFYVPGGGLKGKTVLHAGAGEGETMPFWVSKGVHKVVCIEADREKAERLSYNARLHAWPVEVFNKRFSYTHPYLWESDLVVVDCDPLPGEKEGGEKELLELPRLDFPLVVEIHGPAMLAKFRQKFPNLRYQRLRLFSQVWVGRSLWTEAL